MRREEVPPLYALVRSTPEMELHQIIAEMVSSGARWFQVREKDRPDSDRLHELEHALVGLPAFVQLWVNDRVDLALAVGADGVHLGEQDLPPRVARQIAGDRLSLGVSTHSLDEALSAAENEAVDYIALGPIFMSETKNVREPLGVAPLRQLRRATSKPIVAIGGIDETNIRAVLNAGADSAAVISALYRDGRYADNVERLLRAAEADE